MQTHMNERARKFLDRLSEQAAIAVKNGTSQITAGAPGEQPLATWTASNGVYAAQMPGDPHEIASINVKCGQDRLYQVDYVTIDGTISECIELLEAAIVALREAP